MSTVASEDAGSRLHTLNTKPSLLFHSFPLALAWKDNSIIHISRDIAKRGNLWNLKQLFISREEIYFQSALKT